MMKHLILFLAALLASPVSFGAAEGRFEGVGRVVAISDVHGAHGAMTETLQQAGILDAELGWSGGDAHLVIVGDILDRGPNSRAAMDLLMRVEREAEAAGGRVHVLVGNHESMLLKGDMRYVSEAEYAAFSAEESAAERASWLAHYAGRQGVAAEDLQAAFDEKYPPGYFAMRRAFRADSKYGEWLLQKDIVVVINRTAFVHGGLSPEVTDHGAEGLNRKIRTVLRDYVTSLATLYDAGVVLPTDSHYDYGAILASHLPALDQSAEVSRAIEVLQQVVDEPLLSTDGPLWYRENVTCSGVTEEFWLEEALAEVGAERLVVGHTPTPTRTVLQRFDGKLLEIDTGMLGFYYKGSGNALVIEGDSLSVVNQSGAVAVDIAEHPRRVGRRKTSLATEDLEALLRNGEILSVEKEQPSPDRPLPRTIVKVTDGTHTVDAQFVRRRSRGIYPGAATYKLDRLLDVDMTPVTVVRDVDGKSGSLQFMPGNTINERMRSANQQGGGASCPLPDQWATMAIFDYLTNNTGRSAVNLVYDKSTWKVMLTENGGTFGSKQPGRPQLPNVEPTTIVAWQDRLSELTDEVIDAEFSHTLDRQRRRALMKRRDSLLEFNPANR